MYDTDTKSQFLELRAKGWSLSRLAERLNVAQRTLVDWNRQEVREKLHRFCLTFASPHQSASGHAIWTASLHHSTNPSIHPAGPLATCENYGPKTPNIR
jgi:hypothetical protein